MNAIGICWTICLILLFHSVFGQPFCCDSIIKDTTTNNRKTNISGILATTIFVNSNWKEINNSSLIISGSIYILNIKSEKQKKRIREIRGELSYLKYFDSTWIKNTDNFILSSIWRFNGRKETRRSLSIGIKSQFTNSWELETTGSNAKRRWISGPLNPLILTAGYGINFSFLNESYLNISFASIKLKSLPRINPSRSDSKIIARTDKIILESQFGSNIQSALRYNFSKNIMWDSFYSIFISSIDKKTISFDIKNSLAIKLQEFFTIKFENKIAYDIIFSNRLQMRNELLFGYYYSK